VRESVELLLQKRLRNFSLSLPVINAVGVEQIARTRNIAMLFFFQVTGLFSDRTLGGQVNVVLVGVMLLEDNEVLL